MEAFKKRKHSLAIRVLLVLMMTAAGLSAFRMHVHADWEYEYGNTYYYMEESGEYATGLKKIEGSWYYFDEDGVMQTGWQTINGLRRYFGANGIMRIGLQYAEFTDDDGGMFYFNDNGSLYKGEKKLGNQTYTFDEYGIGVNGWILDHGGWYYYYDDAYRMRGLQKIDGKWYYFDGTGIMQTGWQTINNIKRYFDEDGVMAVGEKEVDGMLYKFASNGSIISSSEISTGGNDNLLGGVKVQTGWVSKEDGKYYYKTDGTAVSGLYKIDGIWYSFDKNGKMQTGWITSGSAPRYFGSDGKMYTGLKKIDGKWYYFQPVGGKITTGWATVNGVKRYFNSEGVMLKGLTKLDGKWYYLNSSTGAMMTGWQTVNGVKRYFGSDGIMFTGFKKIDSDWYYFATNGKMLTGWIKDGSRNRHFNSDGKLSRGLTKVDGKWYNFDSNGEITTGWATVNGKKRYFNSEGVMVTGLTKLDGKWYYFNTSSGIMGVGWQKMNGVQRYFDDKGVMVTGWQKISSKTYYFRSNGSMVTGIQVIDGKEYNFGTDGAIRTGTVTLLTGGNSITLAYDDKGALITESGKYGDWYYQIDPDDYHVVHAQKLISKKIYMEGIDISEHNGNIDLTKYQNGFVIIRVSWDVVTDLKFKRNIDLCEKLKIPFGVYVYSYAMNESQAIDEAEYALKVLNGRKIPLGIWFDMEDADGWKMRHGFSFTESHITKLCNAFCNRIRKAGYRTGIYASDSWFSKVPGGGYINCPDTDKWVAHWGESNDGTLSSDVSYYAVIHQYSSVPLDKNVLYVDPSYFE